jgi:Xaa-Pro dipeptidase
MNRLEESNKKIAKLRTFLHENKLDAVLLNTFANFAWLTAGGDAHIDTDSKNGGASIFISEKKACIITTNVEADRLEEEEVTGMGFEFVVSKWYDEAEEVSLLEKLTTGLRCGSDTWMPEKIFVGNEIKQLRAVLMEPEIERYRWLGKHSSQAIEHVAREIQPGMTEFEIEGLMANQLYSDSITPTVLLVAVDDRNYKYRHPIPTEKRLEKFALLVCCCRRWGLVTSRSRNVYFGKLPVDLEAKQKAVTYVDAVMMAKSHPGVLVKDVIAAAQEAYVQCGWPGEWNYQHLGGALGYENRDYIGKPGMKEVIHLNQAITWNPTVQGTKSEDTILVNTGVPEIITQTDNWPTIEYKVDGIQLRRPVILER